MENITLDGAISVGRRRQWSVVVEDMAKKEVVMQKKEGIGR